jgi:proline racemase
VRGVSAPLELEATDYHTAGEPFRIVTAGAPAIPGANVRERRETARGSAEIDRVRRLLCHEPRGHADMYGCFVVSPDDDGAEFGALFWHNDGYSTACGHGTIALAVWAVDTGRIDAVADGDTELAIDVPSGRVLARVRRRADRVLSVAFRNVPSCVRARSVPVETSRGAAEVDLSFGGAIYASLDAVSLGLSVTPDRYSELVTVGREVKRALDGGPHARHPSDERLSGVYGTIIFEALGSDPEALHQRNVTVFADGEVDRSPCGSGTSARLALLHADGQLGEHASLRHESIVATEFRGRVVETVRAEGRDAVITEVDGMAFRTGEHRFLLDPHDELGTGFVLR